MKLIASFVMSLFASTVAFAAPTILNWTSPELLEQDAAQATYTGVLNFVENEKNCSLERTWGLEAINNLHDYYGNPLIVVTSIVETSGARCELAKYLDCSSVFVKEDGVWKYDDTTCDKEESAE